MAQDGGFFADKDSASRLRELIMKHPNAIMFSGHTHANVEENGQLRIAQPENGGGIFVHAGIIKSKNPKWVRMDEIPVEGVKAYQISYADMDGAVPEESRYWSWTPPAK